MALIKGLCTFTDFFDFTLCHLHRGRGTTFIQGATFIVFSNVPGAMFIQGATSIPYTRVHIFKYRLKNLQERLDLPITEGIRRILK